MKRQSAAEFLRSKDALVRLILAELGGNAAKANWPWAMAQEAVEKRPGIAIRHLIDAEIVPETLVPIELRDIPPTARTRRPTNRRRTS